MRPASRGSDGLERSLDRIFDEPFDVPDAATAIRLLSGAEPPPMNALGRYLEGQALVRIAAQVTKIALAVARAQASRHAALPAAMTETSATTAAATAGGAAMSTATSMGAAALAAAAVAAADPDHAHGQARPQRPAGPRVRTSRLAPASRTSRSTSRCCEH